MAPAGLVCCGSLLQPALVLQLLGAGWSLGLAESSGPVGAALMGQREGQGGDGEDVVPLAG